MNLASVVLPLLAGLILALLVLALGPIAFPIIVFAFFVLPWLLQDVFRLFLWLIVTWPFLTLYVRIPLPAGIPDLTYDRALVLALACALILQAFLSARRVLKVTPLDILIIMYLVAQVSARLFVLWFGGMGKPDLNGLLDVILVPLLMYWISKNLLVSRSHLKWFLRILLIGGLLICLSGLVEQVVGTEKSLFAVNTGLGGSAGSQMRWMDVPGGRAAGVLGNPGIYGAILGISILAGICCLAEAKQGRIRIVLVAAIGVLLYGVFASYTRSAWVAVFAVLFVAQFLIGGLWKKTLPVFILGLLVLALMWGDLEDSSAIMLRASTTNTVTPRLDLMNLAWKRFLQRPLLGWGSGALDTFGVRQVGASSHNIYLTFLVDGGLALLLSFFTVVGYLLFRAVRVYRLAGRRSFERNAVVAMAGCILIALLSGLALELRHFGYFNAVFWMCAGVIDRIGITAQARFSEQFDARSVNGD